MYTYKLYGLIFRSNERIKQLLISDEQDYFDAEILFGNVSSIIKDYINQAYTEGYKQDAFWFINHIAIFHVFEGKHIDIEMLGNIPVEKAIPFILGYCMSMLFAQRNMLAIHCSSVELNNSAIIIAGYSGSGKTSLTTKFLKQGERLINDDVAIFGVEHDSIYVYPAFPQQNLCLDLVEQYGYDKTKLSLIDLEREKYMISRINQFCDVPTKLKAIFVLSTHQGEDVEVSEVTGTNKLKLFMSNLFAVEIIQKYGLPTVHMKLCLDIVKNIHIYIIKRPKTGDSTNIQIQKIREIIKIKNND